MATYNYSTPQTVTQTPSTRITPNEAQAAVMEATYQVFQKKQKARAEEYDNAYEKWKSGKITNDEFLNAVRGIAAQASTDDERESWDSILSAAEHEVLIDKINTESTLIEARVTSGGMSTGQASTELLSLAEMAAKSGDELTSAKLQLAAAQMQGATSSGGGGRSSSSTSSGTDGVLTEDQTNTKNVLIEKLANLKFQLRDKDLPYINMEEVNPDDPRLENYFAATGVDENGNEIAAIVTGYVGEVLKELETAAGELYLKGADPDVISTLLGEKTGNQLYKDINTAMGWDLAGTADKGGTKTVTGINDLQNQAVNFLNDPVHQVATYDPVTNTYTQEHSMLVENDPAYLKISLGDRGTYYVKAVMKEETSLSGEALDQALLAAGMAGSDLELFTGDDEAKRSELKKLPGAQTPIAYKATLPIDGGVQEIMWDSQGISIPYFNIMGMSRDEFTDLTDLSTRLETLQQEAIDDQAIIDAIPETFAQVAQKTGTTERFQNDTNAGALQPTLGGLQNNTRAPLQVTQQPQPSFGGIQQTAPIESLNSQQQLKVTQPKTQTLRMAEEENKRTLGLSGRPRLPLQSLS